MAWCGSCQRYLTPATLTAEGACPGCGAEVQHPEKLPISQGGPTRPDIPAEAAAERIPWHFWLLLAGAAVYLGWRAVQGVALLLAMPGAAGLV